MEVREEDELFPQVRELGLLRLLHLAHEVGVAPHGGGVVDDRRTRTLVRSIGNAGAGTGSGLHEHPDLVVNQLSDAVRRDGDAVLTVLDLGGHADRRGHPIAIPSAPR